MTDKDKKDKEKKERYNGPGGCANAIPGLLFLLPVALFKAVRRGMR